MKRLPLVFLLHCLLLNAFSQFQGKIIDAVSGESLPSATIILFSSGKKSGLVANKDGIFSFSFLYDSMRVSMVGYRSKTVLQKDFFNSSYFEVKLESAPEDLGEVIIKGTTALDIIKKAIAAYPSFQPVNDFENKGFYREIIKDKENYFSVGEAVFIAQYFPSKESYKLKLIQSRSKEDVSYSRLFEDYHPGGGSQDAVSKSLQVALPDFLDEKKIKYFSYKIDSLVQFDGRCLYNISFDQKPDIKKALEKGKLLIDADDFAVVKYEAENSPIGEPYIKNLTGSDKIIATLLNIDFKRKSWKHRVDFIRIDGRWLLNFVESERRIEDKQSKKNIDLDLTINSEMLFTELQTPIDKQITDKEEWRRKDMVINLPSAFDPSFWGNNTIISPTENVKSIVEAISKNNGETTIASNPMTVGWNYKNRNLFVSYQKSDTLIMIPVMKSWWEDAQSGGMIFKEVNGDFVVETKIHITKNSSSDEMPDKGFQQAGIILRKKEDQKENYIFFGVGTGGNPSPKIFLKKTIESKSKTSTEKNENMESWLRIEKKGAKLIAWSKTEADANWIKQGEYQMAWLEDTIQLGLGVYAGFPGNGPKMKPDMKAVFTQVKIKMQ